VLPASPTPDAPTIDASAQVETIIASGQAAAAGLAPEDLRAAAARIAPGLAAAVAALPPATPERVPFVLVIPVAALPPTAGLPTLRLSGRPGRLAKGMDDVDAFGSLPGVDVPTSLYALVDVQRGSEYRGRTPEQILPELEARGRTPLTAAEGIALVTAHPETLERNHCFHLAGSTAGDRRVPGLWIGDRAPRLGFCWAGNRHDWLGVASVGGRIADGGAG
jgi:hypothetical protein